MCIPSIVCHMSKSFQYGKYLKKIDIFLNVSPSDALTSFLFFPSLVFFQKTNVTLLTIRNTLLPALVPDGAVDFDSSLLSKYLSILFNRYLCHLSKKHMCLMYTSLLDAVTYTCEVSSRHTTQPTFPLNYPDNENRAG
jgi:hypothetical protein